MNLGSIMVRKCFHYEDHLVLEKQIMANYLMAHVVPMSVCVGNYSVLVVGVSKFC